MPSIDALADSLSTYLSADQVNLVRRAYFYAEQAHDGQRRRSGEPYVTHPLAVANILADMHMDHQSLMAAMLHDVIEDTGIAKEALVAQFGETVAELVDGVSKLTQMNFETKAEAQAENFQKMAMAMAIFWKFSAWASALVSKFIWVSLLTPSTSSATVSPNCATSASLAIPVSSITSCSMAAIRL